MALRYWIIAVVVVPVALALAWWVYTPHTTPMSLLTPGMRTVSIGPQTFGVAVADTEALRELGLGQRSSLPAGQGMLFVFDHPGSWGIWMKDMQFPLDIIWARGDGTIITIARNVATSTYPQQVFYPATPDARYVLELNAGATSNIAEGDMIVI